MNLGWSRQPSLTSRGGQGRCGKLNRKGCRMASQKYLDPPPAAASDKASFELLRVWVAEQGQHVSLRSGAWKIRLRGASCWPTWRGIS